MARKSWTGALSLLSALVGAVALGGIALQRGESINSLWLVMAAVCTYFAAYRFYGAFIAAKVMALDDQRATPAERLRNGHDFEPTNKWIVFGHHFAAIAGPGPLVGPTLAAQFGYLPGTLWIIIGAVLGGAVQDFVILFCFHAARRKIARARWRARRSARWAASTALVTVLLIMIILLAVVALVVVNALKGSPWGTFTIARDHAHRDLHGALPALLAAGQSAGSFGHRIRAGDGQHLRRRVGREFGGARRRGSR